VLEDLFYEHTTCIIEYLLWQDVHLKVCEHLSLGLEDTGLRAHGYDATRAIKES
jgi:hypothetical protein